MKYVELLKEEKWENKANEIKKRDNYICKNCKNSKFIENFNIAKLYGFKPLFKKNETLLIIKHNINGVEKNLSFKLENTSSGDTITNYFLVNKSTYIVFDENNILDNYFSPIAFIFIGKDIVHNGSNLKNILLTKVDSLIWKNIKKLHVHHTYYKINLKPWEYPDNTLQTLCWSCHEELHQSTKIPFLDIDNNLIQELTSCPKCFGAGYFPEYKHIENGICFSCHGMRYLEFCN